MLRACDSCGATMAAKSPRARFCSDRCRKRFSRSPTSKAPVTGIADVLVERHPLVVVTTQTLEDAGVLDTIAGQQAVSLARRIASPHETGSAVASLSKELQAVVRVALARVSNDDPLDELRRRRDRKRNAH